MAEATPRIEGAKILRRSTRAVGPIKKEFVTKVLGLESHTFNIGNAKYAAKHKKTVDAIERVQGWGRHLKGNQSSEPSNSASTRVPKGKDWGDCCRSQGYIHLATGHCSGEETIIPTQGGQETRVHACHWAVLARSQQKAPRRVHRICAGQG